MDWDLDTLHRTLTRSDARHLSFHPEHESSDTDVIWTPAYQAHVDAPRMMWVPWVDRAQDPATLWEELLGLARDRGCSTISHRASDRLTPPHHEQAMLDLGFTVESEGHIIGGGMALLEMQPLRHMVESGTGRAIAAARRVSVTLWGTPELESGEATAGFPTTGADPFTGADESRTVVVWMDGYRPAAGGRLTIQGSLAMLEEGGTQPAYRGRGGYATTVDARLVFARNAGCERVVAHTDNPLAEKVLVARGLDIIAATRLYTLVL